MKYNKVIVWGHPLYSHTHSYVHEGYYRALKHMGFEVYWFHDENYPIDFDYENCLFITEGFADKNIPINATSCYFVMYCPSPKKYELAGRYIEIRMGALDFKDHINEYSLDKNKATKIGPTCYFEPKSKNKIKIKNNYVDYEIDDYDKIYIGWATNLLPEEINFEDAYLQRENKIHFCGSISRTGEWENYSNFLPFVKACYDNNIEFIHNDPWGNPLSSLEVISRTKTSLLGVDIRSSKYNKHQLLICRVFKNISYGHLGLTNSQIFHEELDGNCIVNPNTEQLFYDGIKNINNHKMIHSAMKLVKENHTFVNRLQSYFSILD